MEDNRFTELDSSGRDSYVVSPDSIEGKLQQAMVCIEGNRLTEAVDLYDEILAADPQNIYASFNLGMIRQNFGELSEAVACFRTVLSHDPDNFQVLCRLGHAYRDQECWGKAAEVYQRALDQDRDHADIFYNLGLAQYHLRELPAALASYQRTVELDESHAAAYYNQGLIHFENDDYGESVRCYNAALLLRPEDPDSLYNLAVTLARQGDLAGAAECYEKVLLLDPHDAPTFNALGTILRRLKQLDRAEECYRKAIDLRPDYGVAYTNLAVVLQTAERIDEALACYAKAIALGHQPASADYMIAALTNADRKAAPRAYVRDLFDSFADSFDTVLTGELGYNSPELLREMAGKLPGPAGKFPMMIDLGCGTGLVGRYFADLVDYLIGVDLSEKMLAKAAAKGDYAELHCRDIIEFLDEFSGQVDLLVAADVLIYLGDLQPFFSRADKVLRPGGKLLFTTEKLPGTGERRLETSGRYSYSDDYIKRLAAEGGFAVETCREVDLRMEKGSWLRGCLFVMGRN